MACIKCGRELKEQQVFCDECLADAEGYPVDPATPIQLPTYTPSAAPKKKRSKKKADLSPEEQLPRLRSSLRWLLFALAVILLAFCLTAVMLLHLLDQRDRPSAARWIPGITAQSQRL